MLGGPDFREAPPRATWLYARDNDLCHGDYHVRHLFLDERALGDQTLPIVREWGLAGATAIQTSPSPPSALGTESWRAQKLHCAVPMMPSASALAALLLPKRLTSHTPPASLHPAVFRRGQRAALSVRHCRKSLHADATSALALLLVHWRVVERRRAQRVQSPSCPPQQLPSWHAPDWQSLSSAQARPAVQGPHNPPQSMSVSSWLRTRSSQLAALQTPSTQLPVAQSEALRQAAPRLQPAQVPPQSTPVSLPSCRPSWHEGGAQRCVAGGQKSPLAQSAERPQASPSAQRAVHGPAQSTALSPWFRMLSEQLAATQLPCEQECESQSESALHCVPDAGVSSTRFSSHPGCSEEPLQFGITSPSGRCESRASSAGGAAACWRISADGTAGVPACCAGRPSMLGGS